MSALGESYRRSPRNSQFLCRVSAADQWLLSTHPLARTPTHFTAFPAAQHSFAFIDPPRRVYLKVLSAISPSALGRVRCVLGSSALEPRCGDRFRTVDHESRQIAPFSSPPRPPFTHSAHPLPCRLPFVTCPIPTHCLSALLTRPSCGTGTLHVITRALTVKSQLSTRAERRDCSALGNQSCKALPLDFLGGQSHA
jgi:hypothetical protein